MRELPSKLEVIGPADCKHPWTEENGWQSVEIAGGSTEEHAQTIKEFTEDGFYVWIDGFLQDTRIHAAYLIRKKING